MFLSEAWRKARKTHRCWYCGEDIVPGERYHVWNGMTDGQFGTTKTHRECNEAWQSLYRDRILMDDDGLDFGEYWRGTTVRKDDSETRPVAAG